MRINNSLLMLAHCLWECARTLWAIAWAFKAAASMVIPDLMSELRIPVCVFRP